jgi:hypothetical protein
MNEQIEKIYGETCITAGYLDEREFLEKFAQMIVQKCLNMIENEASTYAEPVWAVELVNDIKEHFGVE